MWRTKEVWPYDPYSVEMKISESWPWAGPDVKMDRKEL